MQHSFVIPRIVVADIVQNRKFEIRSELFVIIHQALEFGNFNLRAMGIGSAKRGFMSNKEILGRSLSVR